MDQQTKELWDHINRAIIKFRGIYAAWSKKHEISYNEMLVFYTIRDNGFCTQSLFNISSHTSFRRIFRHSALLNLEIHKGFLRFRALTGEKSARKSIHAEILNRLSETDLRQLSFAETDHEPCVCQVVRGWDHFSSS